jgi:hypothetical protein
MRSITGTNSSWVSAAQAPWLKRATTGRVGVELRDLGPLSPSMRTPGGEVIGGRWRRSLSGDSLSETFPVASVAVLVCCTVLDCGGGDRRDLIKDPNEGLSVIEDEKGFILIMGLAIGSAWSKLLRRPSFFLLA